MKASIFLLLLLEVAYSIAFVNDGAPPPCFSEVYCYGSLLETVQMSRIFNDSKTFVDMKMKSPPKKTLMEFFKFMAEHKNHPKHAQIRRFVEDNFEAPGQEFLKWEPEDWTPYPKFLDNVQNNSLKQWGQHLNLLWKDLGRKINDDVLLHEELYSIIWVPNPVIVPGGRFREFYYWDSYWIIHGLLLSEMFTTARGMLENFLYIVEKHGHIPNGGRVYYLERSQPPLLTPMVKLYLDATKDFDFIERHIDILEREFDYWVQNRTRKVQVREKSYTLAAYGEGSQGPRPESYYEDVKHAEFFKEEHEKQAFYSEIKAAAESGWDFSSRWFNSNGTNQGNLTNTKTRSIIPVDLNAIMYWNAKLLREFNEILDRKDKVAYFKQKTENWLEAVTDVLWHEDVGAWLDYDLQNSIRRNQFYPSNIAPLWTGCYPEDDKERMVRGVLQYLGSQNISSYVGGMPTSFLNTGEQWDYPNVWPPLQHMLIVGLSNTKVPEAEELARKAAETWIKTNFIVFDKTRAMFEKYDTVHLSGGLGGEYEVQLGFGWTNGIILDLLHRYGSEISLDNGGWWNEFLRNQYFLLALAILCIILSVAVWAVICVFCCKKCKGDVTKSDGREFDNLIASSNSSANCSYNNLMAAKSIATVENERAQFRPNQLQSNTRSKIK